MRSDTSSTSTLILYQTLSSWTQFLSQCPLINVYLKAVMVGFVGWLVGWLVIINHEKRGQTNKMSRTGWLSRELIHHDDDQAFAPSNPNPLATFLPIHRLLNPSLASSRVLRLQTSAPTRPRTNPSCSARIAASIPLSSQDTSYN